MSNNPGQEYINDGTYTSHEIKFIKESLSNCNKQEIIQRFTNESSLNFKKWINSEVKDANISSLYKPESKVKLRKIAKKLGIDLKGKVKGSRSIYIVQEALSRLGYKGWEGEGALTADGIFGSRTFFALINFQNNSKKYRELGGETDGLANGKTLESLLNDLENTISADNGVCADHTGSLSIPRQSHPDNELDQPQQQQGQQQGHAPNNQGAEQNNRQPNGTHPNQSKESAQDKLTQIDIRLPKFQIKNGVGYIVGHDKEGNVVELPLNSEKLNGKEILLNPVVQNKIENIMMVFDALYLRGNTKIELIKNKLVTEIINHGDLNSLNGFLNDIVDESKRVSNEITKISSTLKSYDENASSLQSTKLKVLEFIRDLGEYDYVRDYIVSNKFNKTGISEESFNNLVSAVYARNYNDANIKKLLNEDEQKDVKQFQTETDKLWNNNKTNVIESIITTLKSENPNITDAEINNKIPQMMGVAEEYFRKGLNDVYLKNLLLTKHIKEKEKTGFGGGYDGDDPMLSMFSNIEGIGWGHMSDKSIDLTGEVAKIIAIETGIFAVGMFTAHLATAALHGAVWTGRLSTIGRGLQSFRTTMQANRIGRGIYTGMEVGVGAVAFHYPTTLFQNIVKGNPMLQGFGEMDDLSKTAAMFLTMRMFNGICAMEKVGTVLGKTIPNPLKGLNINTISGALKNPIRFASGVVIEAGLVAGVEHYGEIIIDGEDYAEFTVEEFLQAMLMVAFMRLGLDLGRNVKYLLGKKNGTLLLTAQSTEPVTMTAPQITHTPQTNTPKIDHKPQQTTTKPDQTSDPKTTSESKPKVIDDDLPPMTPEATVKVSPVDSFVDNIHTKRNLKDFAKEVRPDVKDRIVSRNKLVDQLSKEKGKKTPNEEEIKRLEKEIKTLNQIINRVVNPNKPQQISEQDTGSIVRINELERKKSIIENDIRTHTHSLEIARSANNETLISKYESLLATANKDLGVINTRISEYKASLSKDPNPKDSKGEQTKPATENISELEMRKSQLESEIGTYTHNLNMARAGNNSELISKYEGLLNNSNKELGEINIKISESNSSQIKEITYNKDKNNISREDILKIDRLSKFVEDNNLHVRLKVGESIKIGDVTIKRMEGHLYKFTYKEGPVMALHEIKPPIDPAIEISFIKHNAEIVSKIDQIQLSRLKPGEFFEHHGHKIIRIDQTNYQIVENKTGKLISSFKLTEKFVAYNSKGELMKIENPLIAKKANQLNVGETLEFNGYKLEKTSDTQYRFTNQSTGNTEIISLNK